MPSIIDQAVATLTNKMSGASFQGSAKFVITGEGSIIVDGTGVRAADDPADVTLEASVDTFKDILDGTLPPTTAFMTGKLSVEGDMGTAMRLASALG